MNEKWLLQTQNYRAPAEQENEREMGKESGESKREMLQIKHSLLGQDTCGQLSLKDLSCEALSSLEPFHCSYSCLSFQWLSNLFGSQDSHRTCSAFPAHLFSRASAVGWYP